MIGETDNEKKERIGQQRKLSGVLDKLSKTVDSTGKVVAKVKESKVARVAGHGAKFSTNLAKIATTSFLDRSGITALAEGAMNPAGVLRDFASGLPLVGALMSASEKTSADKATPITEKVPTAMAETKGSLMDAPVTEKFIGLQEEILGELKKLTGTQEKILDHQKDKEFDLLEAEREKKKLNKMFAQKGKGDTKGLVKALKSAGVGGGGLLGGLGTEIAGSALGVGIGGLAGGLLGKVGGIFKAPGKMVKGLTGLFSKGGGITRAVGGLTGGLGKAAGGLGKIGGALGGGVKALAPFAKFLGPLGLALGAVDVAHAAGTADEESKKMGTSKSSAFLSSLLPTLTFGLSELVSDKKDVARGMDIIAADISDMASSTFTSIGSFFGLTEQKIKADMSQQKAANEAIQSVVDTQKQIRENEAELKKNLTDEETKAKKAEILKLQEQLLKEQQRVAEELYFKEKVARVEQRLRSKGTFTDAQIAQQMANYVANAPKPGDANFKMPEAKRAKYEKKAARVTKAVPVTRAGTTQPISTGASQAAVVQELEKQGITDPKAQANILGQIQEESGFKPRSESLNYSPERAYEVFGSKYFSSVDDARQVLAQGEEAFGNRVYGGRMGNAPDEGFKFRGRGLIQLTGKDNYERMGNLIGVDLVNNPDLANDPEIASRIAAAYYADRGKGKDLSSLATVSRLTGHRGGAASDVRREQYAAAFESKLRTGDIKPSAVPSAVPSSVPTALASATSEQASSNVQLAKASPTNVNVVNAGGGGQQTPPSGGMSQRAGIGPTRSNDNTFYEENKKTLQSSTV